MLRPHKDRFRKMLKDRDPGLRRVAAWALARTGDLDAVPALIDALTDPDESVVVVAREGLQLLSRKIAGLGPPSPSTPEQRREAADRWRAWYASIRPLDVEGQDDDATAAPPHGARDEPRRVHGRPPRGAGAGVRPEGLRRVVLRPGHVDADGGGRRRVDRGRLAVPDLQDEPGVRLAGHRRRSRSSRSSAAAAGAPRGRRARPRRSTCRAPTSPRRRRTTRRSPASSSSPRSRQTPAAMIDAAGRGGPGPRRGRHRAPRCPAAGRSPAAGGPRSSAPAGRASGSGRATAACPPSSAGASSTTPARRSTSTPASSTRSASSWPSSRARPAHLRLALLGRRADEAARVGAGGRPALFPLAGAGPEGVRRRPAEEGGDRRGRGRGPPVLPQGRRAAARAAGSPVPAAGSPRRSGSPGSASSRRGAATGSRSWPRSPCVDEVWGGEKVNVGWVRIVVTIICRWVVTQLSVVAVRSLGHDPASNSDPPVPSRTGLITAHGDPGSPRRSRPRRARDRSRTTSR